MKLHRDGDRLLQLLVFNEECLVSASHQLALITSLPFVHTARRSYRLGVLVKCLDWCQWGATSAGAGKNIKPSHLEEGEVVTRFPYYLTLADDRGSEKLLTPSELSLLLCTHRARNTIKLPGHPVHAAGTSKRRETLLWNHGESRGYGKNLAARDDRQPSANGVSLHC